MVLEAPGETTMISTAFRLALTLAALLLLSACPAEIEGDEAGECDDGVDNDQDGVTDCDDDGCAAATVCVGGDDDDVVDDDDAGDDDSSVNDDDSALPDDDDAVDDDDSSLPDDDDDSGDDDDSAACADTDGDGFEDEACGGLDCDDADDAVHPAAQEVCANTVDDDCDGVTDDVGCVDADGWVLLREELLDGVPVDAVVQTNWGPAQAGGRDAVCVSSGSDHYLTLSHGDAATADRVAVQVDAYAHANALDLVLQAALGSGASSYFRLRLWQSMNEAVLIEYHSTLGSNNELHTTTGYPSQAWHTLRVEFDRTTGDVAAEINGVGWYDGTAFLASLVGTELSLYGYGGDSGTNHVCFTNLSIWSDGSVGTP